MTLDPSHLDLNQPLIFTLALDFHEAPFEPSLQCVQCQSMLLTKFDRLSPPVSNSLASRLDFFAASPLPDPNLSYFRHPNTA